MQGVIIAEVLQYNITVKEQGVNKYKVTDSYRAGIVSKCNWHVEW